MEIRLLVIILFIKYPTSRIPMLEVIEAFTSDF